MEGRVCVSWRTRIREVLPNLEEEKLIALIAFLNLHQYTVDDEHLLKVEDLVPFVGDRQARKLVENFKKKTQAKEVMDYKVAKLQKDIVGLQLESKKVALEEKKLELQTKKFEYNTSGSTYLKCVGGSAVCGGVVAGAAAVVAPIAAPVAVVAAVGACAAGGAASLYKSLG